MTLSVEDDGRGFPDGGAGPDGMGLRSMRARAMRHGGTLAVDTGGGGGTRVRLSLPAERALAD